MQETTVDLKKIHIDPGEPIDYSYYDQPKKFTHTDASMQFECRMVPGNGTLKPLHDFMPWGMSLDFPLLRDFNASCTGKFGGDITFYAMHGVRFRFLPTHSGTVLEQLADKWLETYVSTAGHREINLSGASLGGLFASIVASKAKKFGLEISDLYLFEPAGAKKKSLAQARKQITEDTRYDFQYSLTRFGTRAAKLNIAKDLFNNLSYERRVLNSLLEGGLANYINKYLQDYPEGKVHIFHSAESSYLSYSDLGSLNKKIEYKDRVFYIHALGARHGMGPNFRQLAKLLLKYMANDKSV